MARYQSLYDVVLPREEKDRLAVDWIGKGSSLFVTYPPAKLAEIAGFVAAMVTGMIRYHMT